MIFRSLAVAVALAFSSAAPSVADPAAPAAAALPARTVMTWVPPYSRDISWTRLNQRFGAYGPANSLTRLGLQFWKPTSVGGLVRVSAFGAISNIEIAKYVNWAHANGIKVMLTVYNGEPTWDWALARAAFGPNKTKFVNALVAEMTRLKLDGVDVDLEGPGIEATAAEKAQYVAFMTELAQRVHALGKLVQIDTFAWIYNSPNQTWWPSLFPVVDTIASMGYEEIGRNATGWAAFAAQRRVAGSAANMSKLILGVPSYQGTWQGDDAATQLAWFVPVPQRVGVGIWDAQLPTTQWRTAATWASLFKIRAQNK